MFSKQILLFGFSELADPDNEKQPMTSHFGQKSGLAKLQFLFYSTAVSKNFNQQHTFIIIGNKEGDFLPIPGFLRTTTQIQGLSRAWKFFPLIPGLSRIFKDSDNPACTVFH